MAIGDQEWLATNDLIVRNIAGVCLHCQEPFYWSASDKMLADMVRQTLALRHQSGV